MKAALLLLIACTPSGDCPVQLWFVDEGQAREVQVRGAWSGWEAEPLSPVRNHTGAWHLELELPAGDHAYVLEVDGRRQLDPYAPLIQQDPISGEERSLLRLDSCGQPSLRSLRAGLDATGAGELSFGWDGGARNATLERLQVEVEGEVFHGEPSGVGATVKLLGLGPGKHHLQATGWSDQGDRVELRFPLWAEDRPFRWRDALIYQVVTDRFADERGALAPEGWEVDEIADRYGGTWAGLRQKLEQGYFDELGVRALWISPVLDNPEGRWPGRDGHEHMGYHGYWPASPDALEPAFGEPEELEALVEAAHARGMRVLIDVVPNHLHESHPYRALHPDWFNENPDCICGAEDCPWDSEMETCWFTEYLPDLDWTHPEVAPALTADLVALAESTNADGFRVDAVPMMPRAAVRELAWALGRRFEAGPVDFYLLGEIFTGAGGQGDIRRHLGPHALDGAFDFPAMWALRGYAAGDSSGAELELALQQSEAAWAGSRSVMSPFLGNHDVPRITSELAGQVTSEPWTSPPNQPHDPTAYARLRIALTLLHALPGAPTLYQGDEIGMAGANDPDNRRPMRFAPTLEAEQLRTLDLAQALGQARASQGALRRGERLPLATRGGALAWLRDSGDQRPALLVANSGEMAEELGLRLPAGALPADGLAYVDAADSTFQLRLLPDRELQLQLSPLTARLLVPAEP